MVYEHPPLSPLAEVPTPPVPAFAQATRDNRERERGSDRSGSSRRITTSVQVSTPRDSGSESPPKPLPSLPALPSVQGHQSHQSHQSIPALPPSIQRAQYPGSLKMPTSPHIPPSSSYNTSGRPGQGPAVHQLHQGQMATSPLIDAGSQGHGHGYGQSHTNHHDEGSSMPLPGPTRPWAVDTSSGSYRSPPAPVWRMPSFRRGSGPSGGGGGGDKNVRQSRGIDMPGGPTPDERLSRYGRLRAFSGMSMSGYGYGRPNSTLGANGTSGVNGVNGSAMGNGYHDTMMKNVSKRPLTVAERLMPTLELARVEREKCARKARWTNIMVNIALGALIVLGALTTGLSAAVTGRQVSIITSIFGGLSTLVASYVTRIRGSGEPENSRLRTKDLNHFIREVESVVLDRGWRVNKLTASSDVGVLDSKDDLDILIDEFRRRFEEIMGNLEERHINLAG